MSLFQNGLFAVMLVVLSPAAMGTQTFLSPKTTTDHLMVALDKACSGSDPAALEKLLEEGQIVGLPAAILDLARARLKALQAPASPQNINLKEDTGLHSKRLLAGMGVVSAAEKAKADAFNAALALKRQSGATQEKKFVASYKRANALDGNEYHAGGHRDYKAEPPVGFSQREWAEWKKDLYSGDMPQHVQPVTVKESTVLTSDQDLSQESIDPIWATQGWSESPRVLPWKGHAHGQEDDLSANRERMRGEPLDIRR